MLQIIHLQPLYFGAFSLSRNVPINFVMSVRHSYVCPSLSAYEGGSHRRDFCEIWYREFYKIQWKRVKLLQFCTNRQNILIFPAILYYHKSGLFDGNGCQAVKVAEELKILREHTIVLHHTCTAYLVQVYWQNNSYE